MIINIRKILLLLPLLFLLSMGQLCADKNALNNASQSPQWEMKQQSKDKHFDVKFVCSSMPSVGTFQNCQLTIIESLKKNEKMVFIEKAKILLTGGMPAHHHGLPTSPVVSWSDTENVYKIKGLKFSMPGDWFLRFHIKNSDSNIIDKVLFNFSI